MNSSRSQQTFFNTSLAAIDAFGQLPPLRILNLNKYSTRLGQFLTIGIIAICLAQALSQLINTLNYSTPNVVFNQQLIKETEPFYLGKENFTLALVITDVSSTAITDFDRYLNLTIQNCQQVRTVNPTTGGITITNNCHNYAVERCTSDHFPAQYQKDALFGRNISNMACMNSAQWDQQSPFLQGSNLGSQYAILAVYVTPCVNTTAKSLCYPKAQITAKLTSFQLFYYTTDILVTMNNKEQPLQPILSLQGTQLQVSQSVAYIQQNVYYNVTTDDGLVTSSKQTVDAAGISTTSASIAPFNSYYYCFFYIAFSNKSGDYSRTYLKLQQIFGQLGGLWQTLYFITFALINPMIFKIMNIELVNRVFQFEGNNVDNKSIFRNNKSMGLQTQGLKTERDPKDKMLKQDQQQSPKQTENRLINYMKKKEKSLNLNFCAYTALILGFKAKEKQQIDFAATKILNKLDINFIISKLIEIEKLKTILLTKEQKFLFDYLPKPTIPQILFEQSDKEEIIQSIGQNPIYDLILQEEKSDVTKLLEAQQAYSFLKNSKSLQSSVDIKLINQIDPEIIDLFDQFVANQSGEFNAIFQKYKIDASQNMARSVQVQDDIIIEEIQSVENESNIQRVK